MTSYGPARTLAKEYAPCASVVVSRVRLVSVLTIDHLRAGNDRSLRVDDRSDEAAIEQLRRGGRRRDSHDEADAQNAET